MTGKVPAILRFMSRLFGYAAQSLSTRLEGGRETRDSPEGFFVEGTEGPLKAGELERAADWPDGLEITDVRNASSSRTEYERKLRAFVSEPSRSSRDFDLAA